MASSFSNHDRRIEVSIPGHGSYAEYGVDTRAPHATPGLLAKLRAKSGGVSTGNSFDFPELDKQRMEAAGAACKDMEVAGIAWAASLTGTPLVAIKVVTDLIDVDKPGLEQFLANLATAAASLQEAIPAALEHVMGRAVDDL